MNNEPLMDAVVQMVLFLELSPSEVVDEDAAVGMLEQIASTLQRLEPKGKTQLVQYLRDRASRTQSKQERQAFEEMAGWLGITPE